MRELDLLRGARAAEELLLAAGHELTHKAANPVSRAGFNKLVAKLVASLVESTEDLDRTFATRMLEALDVDFSELSAAEREEVLHRAELALPKGSKYVREIGTLFSDDVEEIVIAARMKTLSGVKLPELDLAGDEVLALLEDAAPFHVEAAIEARNADLNARVRALVLRSVTEGWRRQDLVRQLEKLLGPSELLSRQTGYYDVVAASHIGYARTYGQLTALRDAEIQTFRFESVLDEVTSDVCRFMHGHVFEVEAAFSVFERMAGFVDNAKDASPWLRVGVNANGEQVLYTKADQHRREIAVIARSGVGRRDDEGEYVTPHDAASLQALGLCIPPLHGRCRSTIVGV